MNPPYVLHAAAAQELRDIIRYTRAQWGDRQARDYAEKLGYAIGRLARGEGRVKALSDLHPGLIMARCAHHYVFCLPRPGQPALILAILHERMDLMARLSDRLEIK